MLDVKTLVFGMALLAISQSVGAQTVAPCSPTTPRHQRWAMKTRKEPATFNVADATTLSIQDIVKWKVPKGKILTDSTIDPHEDQIVTVTGWVRLVKISPDDCDIHVQLGRFPDKHVPQIIVEIPATEPAVRQALAAKLGVDIPKPGRTLFFDGPKAVQVSVIGPAFDDSSHWTSKHPKTGNKHGSGVSTLWEIHPVWDVK